jgi:3-methyladenine DNA glycosylase/8-oxoguanine DNA glycosylase
MFLLGQLGRADVLPAGDLGIRQAVQAAYGLDRIPGEQEVRRIGEAWRPNRSLATAYLYSALRSQRGAGLGRPVPQSARPLHGAVSGHRRPAGAAARRG